MEDLRYSSEGLTKIPVLKENELIQQCKMNSYAAQMHVYKIHKDLMYNACWRLLKNKHDAEDAVHDSFIKGFRKIHQLKDDTNLGGWLKRIAINHCVDIIRKRKNIWVENVERIEVEDEETTLGDEELSIEFIKNCMNSLKEKYRIILVLYMIEDYTHKEISNMLKLKESTVRNQYKRGKEQLIKLIQNSNEYELKGLYTEK